MDSGVSIPKNFSVIISVYLYDNVDHFIEAMNSIFRQTLSPYEIILAVDGPISNNMESVVGNFENNPIVRIVRSDVNIGRGAIKHRAILTTTTEFIAIMDADDISIDCRFELQVNAFIDSEIDLVGGYVSEFNNSIDGLKRQRKVPLKHEEIIKQGKWIQPYNHVTIMFNKSMYIKSGGYGKLYMVEDYDLFFHMAMNGAIFLQYPKNSSLRSNYQ